MFDCCTDKSNQAGFDGYENKNEISLSSQASEKGENLKIKQELALPWSTIQAENLKTYFPLSWSLPNFIVQTLRNEGIALGYMIPTVPVRCKISHVLLEDDGKYLGEVVSNQMHGIGHWYHANGDYYAGEFDQGFYDGVGIFIHKSGDWFLGTFDHGQKRKGTLYSAATKQKYIGKLMSGVPEGEGELIFDDGRKYKGNFKNGQRSGKGKFTWPNGNIYNGNWANDKQNGSGELYVKQQDKTFLTHWKDGILLD